nr:uncharacterized protein LOC108066104 [Drosophila takahashii]
MDKFVLTSSSLNKAAPTPQTHTETSSDSHPANKKISVSENRKVRTEWLDKFSWLKNDDGRASCIACGIILRNHLTHIQRHSTQASHIRCLKIKESQLKIDTFTKERSDNNYKQVRDAEYALVMFLVMHNLPFLLMDYLPDLLRVCCPDSKIAKGVKCGRTKATDISKELAKKAMQRIVSALQETKFSLIVDETTDVANKKALVLVVRYFHNISGSIRDQFLALIEVEKCDAQSIYNAIKAFFSDNQIPLKNLIGLATDGANVMAGGLNSLKTKLSGDTHLFSLKCTCHSLHLCSGYACKKLPSEIEMLCRKIYSYFSFSPKRTSELKEFQEYCSIKPHKILGIAMTRWLSLEKVISRILEQWDALELFFSSQALEVNNIKPKEIANSMAKPELKIYLLFLSFILKIINDLNVEFQSESARLPYLYARLQSSIKLILSNIVTQDYVKNMNLEELNICDLEIYFLPVEEIFIGFSAQQCISDSGLLEEQSNSIKVTIRQFYLELVDQITRRFDFSRKDIQNLVLITPAKVLSAEEWNIVPLLKNFEYLCESEFDKIINQWKMLKLSNDTLKKETDIILFWDNISMITNGLNESVFKDLIKFVHNLLSLPHSSAAAERKFFAISLIKTKLRNKLEFNTVSSIMLCKELILNKETHYVWSHKDLN